MMNGVAIVQISAKMVWQGQTEKGTFKTDRYPNSDIVVLLVF